MTGKSTVETNAAFRRPRSNSTAPKGDIAGVDFTKATRQELCRTICDWLAADSKHGHTATYVNPHVFNLAARNDTLRSFLRSADIVAVDGIGFALAVRWLTGYPQSRTVMTPLFDDVVGTRTLPPLRAVLIGGRPAVLERGASAINGASACIKIIATHHGYASAEENTEFLRAHSDIDVVLVAMGSPRSEELIERVRDVCRPKIFWNIGGGTLHYYAGTLKRVPEWVSRSGFQWLWRIVHEPAIAPRYILGVPKFIGAVARSRAQRATQQKRLYGSAYR